MKIEEAIEAVGKIECENYTLMDTGELRQFLQTQQAEIDRLQALHTKVCPKCLGSGEVILAVVTSDPDDINKSAVLLDDCPTCKGDGKVPRCVLPERFLDSIDVEDIWVDKVNGEIFSHIEDCSGTVNGKKILAKITKVPDGWELTEVTE